MNDLTENKDLVERVARTIMVVEEPKASSQHITDWWHAYASAARAAISVVQDHVHNHQSAGGADE